MKKEKCFFFICSLRSLRHDQERNFFFFSYYDHYAMIKTEKSFFLLATRFTNEERKMFFFIYSVRSVRHDQERKFFFHLAPTITAP